jgi:ubiquitin-conjugating enzyme E2 H
MYDNSTGIERIKKEFNHIKNEAVLSLIEGDISTINNDYKHLRVCFKGPKGTPYDNGIYYFDIVLKDDYPSSKPLVKFMTKIFHPNIELNSGIVCLYYINHYSQYNTLSELILIIYNLLAKPNFDDLLNPLAKKEDYEKTANEYNKKYANKLKNWTTYNFIPIIIIVNDIKGKQTQITIQLNEKICSAKEKFYKIIGDNRFSQWLFDCEILCDSRTFENYDIRNKDEITANGTSIGG